MKKALNYIPLALLGCALFTLTLQNQKLSLRESLLDNTRKESEQLRHKLSEAEKKIVLLQESKAAAETTDQALSTSRIAASTPATPTPTPDRGNKMMKLVSQMLKNPAMKEMMATQQMILFDQQYAGLMEQLQLQGTEKDAFKQIIVDGIKAQSGLGLKLMDESLSPEQRNAIAKEITDSKQATDQQVRTFLNDESDFQAYRNWEETKTERLQINAQKTTFAAAGAPLDARQEQQLLEAMVAVRKQPKPGVNLTQGLTPEAVSQQMANYDLDAQQLYNRAAGFLSPAQLETFQQIQQQQRGLQEAGLKMATMAGGSGAIMIRPGQ